MVVLFLCSLFLIAWRAPDPPLSEYGSGIELNFGLDNQGYGDIQPDVPVGNNGAPKEKPEESKPEPQEEAPKETPRVIEKVEEKVVEKAKPVEEERDEDVVSSKAESPVTVKEKKEDPKPVEKKPEPKVEDKPKVEEKPKVVEEKPKLSEEAVFKPKTQTSTASGTKTGDGKPGSPGNHGDDPGTTGDKGSPQGTLDADALYGKAGHGNGGAGGSGGSSLELSGWKWDERPNPQVPNNESGRLVFEIKVDGNGDIVSIRTIERSVSTNTEQICRREVEKLTFSKIGSNVPEMSTGKITFVIRAR